MAIERKQGEKQWEMEEEEGEREAEKIINHRRRS